MVGFRLKPQQDAGPPRSSLTPAIRPLIAAVGLGLSSVGV